MKLSKDSCYMGLGKKISTVKLQQEQTIYNTDVKTVTRFCDESVRI